MAETGVHLSHPLRNDANFENSTVVETYQGRYEDLVAFYNRLDMTARSPNGGIYIGASLQRMNAGRGQLELTEKVVFDNSWWGFDFACISKPIKTWLATKIANATTLQQELAKVDLWEQQKSNGRTDAYLEYKYDAVNSITNEFTLALCNKMKRGVDSYDIYTPVATCVRTKDSPFTDGLNSIGKYRTTLTSPTDPIPVNRGQLQAFAGLRPYWLKTQDSITQNSDGTLTRRESFTGLDDIDRDLYQQG